MKKISRRDFLKVKMCIRDRGFPVFIEWGSRPGRKIMRKDTTHNLTVAAMLSAVAFILMLSLIHISSCSGLPC